jgi:hypothetical protein
MRRFAVQAWLIGIAVVGCGSSGDAGTTSPPDSATAVDVGSNGGGSGTAIGSGALEGVGSFPITTVRWVDPGPFSEKARLEVYLSSDAGCGRPKSCAPYRELMLRVSSPKGGTVTPGVYSVIAPKDAGVVSGSLEARVVTVTQTDGCNVNTQPGPDGTVTIESISATEIKGTFDINVMARDGSEPRWTGRFDALRCP